VKKSFRPLRNASELLEAPTGDHVTEQDGYGKVGHAIAVTPYGAISGKATAITEGECQCWYTYGGHEVQARDFKYIFSR